MRVRFGHRRTRPRRRRRCRDTVPVLVVGEEDTTADDEATRLVQQWAENEHRAGLSGADRLNTIEQLSLLGVSAAQLDKRTKAARKDVDAALAIAGSELARAAGRGGQGGPYVVMPVGCPTCVIDAGDIADLSDGLAEDARLVGSGADLLAAVEGA